jgi:protease IV
MTQPLPPGQNPVDPRGAFSMPPLPAVPPPGMPPPGPMIYPPMPPFMPPPRRGGRWILLTMLIIALAVSVLINMVQLGVALVGAAAEVRQTVISGEGSDKIAVVPIDGIIDDNSTQTFETLLKEVEKDSAVRALVVEIDTPGGSATASDEMYHRLDEFKKNKNVPVVIAMRGMATSGGYYVSSAGDYIFAEPGCLTGNIGVLFPRFNLSKMVNKWGVYESTLTATTPGHSYKNAGSMFEPENPQDEVYLQGLVDGTFSQFKLVCAGPRIDRPDRISRRRV